MSSPPTVVFSMESGDETSRVLASVRDVLMRHPMAAQAAFSALVAEGRQYALTAEGSEFGRRLAGSELLSRLRIIWESLGMTAFVERPTQALPSFFVDGVVRAASEEDLETRLSEAFDPEL